MASLLGDLTSALEVYNHVFYDLSRPVADVFGLKNLGAHFHVFVYSFIFFNFANIVFVPGLSRLFFNRTYGALDARTRNKWYVALLLIPLTPWVLRSLRAARESMERAYICTSREYIVFVRVSFCETDLYPSCVI